MVDLLDTVFKLGPLLTFGAALIAARLAWRFGEIQANIVRQQAETSAAAAATATARNKLRVDLIDRRLKIYDLVTKDSARATEIEDFTKYFQSISAAKWLFDKRMTDWIYKELGGVVRDLKLAQAEASELEPGKVKGEKMMLIMKALKQLNEQYERRDEVFAPFLNLTAE